MKIMLLLTLFLSVSFASECVPNNTDCSFYLCLEKEKKCGYRGFPLRYGYRFCQYFEGMETYSEKLNTWLSDTRICLQEKLKANDYSCQYMFYNSIQDHVSCYEDSGYCALDKGERRIVRRKILRELLDAPIYIVKNAVTFLRKACR